MQAERTNSSESWRFFSSQLDSVSSYRHWFLIPFSRYKSAPLLDWYLSNTGQVQLIIRLCNRTLNQAPGFYPSWKTIVKQKKHEQKTFHWFTQGYRTTKNWTDQVFLLLGSNRRQFYVYFRYRLKHFEILFLFFRLSWLSQSVWRNRLSSFSFRFYPLFYDWFKYPGEWNFLSRTNKSSRLV